MESRNSISSSDFWILIYSRRLTILNGLNRGRDFFAHTFVVLENCLTLFAFTLTALGLVNYSERNLTMQCVILAGGRATRMSPVTNILPKSLLVVSGHPFIHYQLQKLKKQGVDEVLLCVGYKGELIRNYVKDGSQWGLRVDYSFDGIKLKGTLGALGVALMNKKLREHFFLMYGDSYLNVSFEPVWKAYHYFKCKILMTVYKNSNSFGQSNVRFFEGKVEEYSTSPSASELFQYIDYGLMVLNRNLIKAPPHDPEDLSSLLREVSLKGWMRGFEVKTRFYEIGSMRGFLDFEQFMTRQKNKIVRTEEHLNECNQKTY